MPDPMKIRATLTGDKVEVKVLMAHEMETGYRKDDAGKVIPAHFIDQVTATCNGKTVLSAQWGPSVAKNPFLAFRFNGAKKGDTVTVKWTDNLGATQTNDVVIT
jgi:sulfur-oxidizing protein SoxZ